MEERRAVSVREAARLLGVTTAMIYKSVANKTIAAHRLGRKIVIPRASIEKFLTVE